MTKTSVNKIRFAGPKTHNEILAKIRTDIYETGTGIAVETVSFIVSSFFSKQGFFRDIEKRKRIFHMMIGSLNPITKEELKSERNKIQKIKRKAAIKYLTKRHRDAHFFKQQKVIIKYNKWCAKREQKGYDFVPLDTYMIMYEIKFPEYIPVSEAAIQGVLYKFDDKGKVVIRRRTRAQYMIMNQRNAEKKAQKALLTQH